LRALTNRLNAAAGIAREAQELGTETAAQQWLIGNTILLQRTLQRLKSAAVRHRWLPAQGAEARVLIKARAWIDALDGRLDEAALEAFGRAQLDAVPLTVSELDALGDALALALMEQITILGCIGNTRDKKRLRDLGEDVVRAEQAYLQRQAQLDYRMAALIQNLRTLEEMDVERLCAQGCPADVLLQEDDVFRRMDRGSRGVYRTAVSEKAYAAGRSEEEVVRAALDLAREQGTPFDAGAGYYLLDEGQSALNAALSASHLNEKPAVQKGKRVVFWVAVATLLLLAPVFFVVPLRHALWAALLCVPLAENVALEIVRRAAGRKGKKVLCALDFSKGIPDACATAVVMPVLLTSPSRAREVAASLEALYLGNRSDNLVFVMLGDYCDAREEHIRADDAIAREAKARIQELNARYGPRFFYLQRPRTLREKDGVYMGRERKRGAMCDLAALLTAGDGAGFLEVDPALQSKRFVYMLTLDADTQMEPGGAHRLIGALAHPLNRAHMDEDGRVLRGYGILQPIVRITLRSAARTAFAKSFSAQAGVDAYAGAVGDGWFKYLGQGAFTGKGLIDLAVYARAACAVLPGDAILSHDLIEGALCRVAMCDRVQVLDGCPPRYLAWAKREHRWMRGDWQLVSLMSAGLPLLAVDRLRMADNLLRPLRPVALLILFLLCAWTGFCWLLLFAVLLWTGPFWVMLFSALIALPRGEYRGERLRTVGKSCLAWLECLAFDLMMLPHRAYLSLHAISCALYRVYVSRKKLFEWVTAADAEAASPNGVWAYVLGLWQGPAAAALLCLLNIYWAPLAALWTVSPIIAWAMGKERAHGEPISRAQRQRLGVLGRRTWDYFVRYVTEQTHYLPPDNVQFAPRPGPALRTSPTNIGYALLANACAAELSWIGWEELCARTERTLATVEGLETFKGHLYNWYDINTLTPLCPRYISTVDSGNLVCALMTVCQALHALPAAPVSPARVLEGIAHALEADGGDGSGVSGETLEAAHALLSTDCGEGTRGLIRLRETLEALQKVLRDDACNPGRAAAQVRLHIQTLDALMPWLSRCPEEAAARADVLDRLISMRAVYEDAAAVIALLNAYPSAQALSDAVWEGHVAAREKLLLAGPLIQRMEALIRRADFSLLYDEERELLYIGMDGEGETGSAHYDLWTSEARLTSLVAMGKGEVPFEHYRRLGRIPTRSGGHRTLISWSGTMFEYLMTRLFVPDPPGSMAETVHRGAIRIQREYAARIGLPFGMSESGYYAFDQQLNYQYKAFGVPDIGFKSGLVRERVIAPYASVLAAMVDPQAALANMERLEKEGAGSAFGFYEALDYTPERVGADTRVQVVKSAMAHHQGMTLCAVANILADGAVQRWFMRDPGMRALTGLLEERNMDTWPRAPRRVEGKTPPAATALPGRLIRRVEGGHISHLLSGGRYHVRITATGGGMSMLEGVALNRWRNDPVLDEYGLRVEVHPAEHKPFCAMPGPNETLNGEETVEFFPHLARFVRSGVGIRTELQVFVCPEPDAEVRLLTIENPSNRTLTVEAVCAFEPVLCPLAQDVAHPAFSNLFLECSADPQNRVILCRRRKRTPSDPAVCAGAWLISDEKDIDFLYCLDREQYIRGHMGEVDTKSPHPVMAWGARVAVPARSQRTVAFVVGMAQTLEEVYGQRDMLNTLSALENARELARAFAQAAMRHIGLEGAQFNLCQRMTARVLYAKNREEEAAVRAADLWSLGISGDVPIVLSNVYSMEQLDDVRCLFAFYRYWVFCGLDVCLVFINRSQTDYFALLGETLRDEAQRVPVPQGNRGSVRIFDEKDVSPQAQKALTAAAHVVLNAGESWRDFALGPERAPARPYVRAPGGGVPDTGPLLYDNGLGGFTEDGSEYVIRVEDETSLPAPWCNVLANERFGTLCAAQGIVYTWAENSRQNKLTPWHNDNAGLKPGETVYLLDTGTDALKSLTPAPAGTGGTRVRFSPGTARYEGAGGGLSHALTVWADAEKSLKYARVDLKNTSERRMRLRVCYYADWVLGVSPHEHARTVKAAYDAEAGVLYASNAYFGDGRTAFLCADATYRLAETDRGAFLGAGGTRAPSGLAAMDSSPAPAYGCACGALAADITLAPGAHARLHFALGYGEDREQAQRLAQEAQEEGAAGRSLERARAFWAERLQALRIKTPDRALDIMANVFLPYQVTACRLWARTAAYQAGGAYGFRDQLQDALALLYTRPDEVRAHILRCARHQFMEGDVQHWWHPPATGVRTHISDDLLFLPYAIARYVRVTGDASVLYETAPFLEGEPLDVSRADAYFDAKESENVADVYAHGLRAIDCALSRMGAHGLPLILGGDWNDGMNEVGKDGKGESVWLAFFLYRVLMDYAETANVFGRQEDAVRLQERAHALRESIEAHAWDGGWYLRAFYDDGASLGSQTGEECRIDCISQAWAAISGAAPRGRAVCAMDAVREHLLDQQNGLLRLFTPPFNHGERQAGYIRGYLPGVRENGGQYTHAAMWVCLGLLMLGDGAGAHALLSMLNPVERTRTPERVQKYRGEPYAVAADVYTLKGQEGRAGWTWYTGAASWMLQCVYAMLGIHKRGNSLYIEPCIPPAWDGFSISYAFGSARYEIEVVCGGTGGDASVPIALIDDGEVHRVRVRVPRGGA
jgi:cellobiose phosphorylase